MKRCIIQVKGATFAKLQKGLETPHACKHVVSWKIHILTTTTDKKTQEISPSNACRVSFNNGEKEDESLALRCGGGGVWEGCRPNKHPRRWLGGVGKQATSSAAPLQLAAVPGCDLADPLLSSPPLTPTFKSAHTPVSTYGRYCLPCMHCLHWRKADTGNHHPSPSKHAFLCSQFQQVWWSWG